MTPQGQVTLRECEPQGRCGEELREVVAELWPGTGGIGQSFHPCFDGEKTRLKRT